MPVADDCTSRAVSTVKDGELNIDDQDDATPPAAGGRGENQMQPPLRDGATHRRVLVIAYYFPPMGLSGVIRIAKFAKYLREFGWEPTILTVGDVGYFAYDYSLLEEVLEAGVTIERTRTLDPLRLMKRRGTIRMPVASRRRFVSGITQAFLQPDNKIGWKRFALKRAAELIEQKGFDAIFATAPPFTDFLIGRELQKRYDLPLVIDYRDPWLDNRDYFYVTPLHRSYAARMEEMVLKNAESVVVVNRRIKEQLLARYPFLTHELVHILPSGYDSTDFRLAARHPLPRPRKLRITYSGICDVHRSPKTFFQALSKIFAQHPESRDEIEVCFVGTFQEKYRSLATNLGVASALVITGYLEHLEAVRHLVSSDVLWLTTADPAITPGKIHEYIGTRKPILALVPDGVIKQVLADYGAATIVDPNNVEAISAAIFDLYTKWQQNALPVGREEVAREYEQRRVTERLARILAHAVRI